MSSGERTLIWRGRQIGPSSVVTRLPLPAPARTPAPELLPRRAIPVEERYPRIEQQCASADFGVAVGSSVEIDLGDLDSDDARDLLVSEARVGDLDFDDWRFRDELDEMEALLALGTVPRVSGVSATGRSWLRRLFACGAFVVAFWLAHAQLSPWLD